MRGVDDRLHVLREARAAVADARETGSGGRCAGRSRCRGARRSTSAPTRSQRFAISFMNEMRVASSALAAYLVISALAVVHDEDRVAGAHERLVELAHDLDGALGSRPPMTTRSGFMKSSIAAPSFRNSGFETTSNGVRGRARDDRGAHFVRGADRHGALVDDDPVAVHRRADLLGHREHGRAGRPRRPSLSGVPTAMKQIAAPRTASARSVGERRGGARRRCAGSAPRARARRSAPCPACSASIFAASMSTQMTSLPLSAKQVPATSPTYPVPITQSFTRASLQAHRAPAGRDSATKLPAACRTVKYVSAALARATHRRPPAPAPWLAWRTSRTV